MSLIIALAGRKRVVVASDSRGCAMDGSQADRYQKLYQAGQFTAVGTTGALDIAPGVGISERIAGICAREELRDSPRALLEALRDELREELTSRPNNRFPDGPIMFGAFAIRKKPDGWLDLLELEFAIETAADGSRFVGEPTLKAHFQGMPRGSSGFSIGQRYPKGWERAVNLDSTADAIVSGVDRIFAMAKAESEKANDMIGGPIDVAVIETTGFKWLRRKEPEPLAVPPPRPTVSASPFPRKSVLSQFCPIPVPLVRPFLLLFALASVAHGQV
jgi:hypothetical protein